MELAPSLDVKVGLAKLGGDAVDTSRPQMRVLTGDLLEKEGLGANAGRLAGLGES